MYEDSGAEIELGLDGTAGAVRIWGALRVLGVAQAVGVEGGREAEAVAEVEVHGVADLSGDERP